MGVNSPAEITEIWINNGIKKANLPVGKMLVLGMLAGAYIGFGANVFVLATAAGGSGSMITVYDETMTQVRGSYPHGTKAMLLRYGPSSCMIYVGGGVAYVSTWNVNY